MSRLTVAGRVETRRRRYQAPGVGSVAPLDAAIDLAGKAISLGTRELVCRLSLDAFSYERTQECLQKAAGLVLSAETLRQVATAEGRAVLAAQEMEQLELDWTASDCTTEASAGPPTTRLYLGCDGVMVPTLTQGEKQKRREKALDRRKQLPRKKGIRRLPLPTLARGTPERYKEMKLVSFYDQAREHRLVRATRKGPREAGRLMRQGMVGLRIRGAQERIALVDGAPWIARQIEQRRPPFDALTLDFWHLAEHVHATRREVWGEKNPAGVVWAQEVLETVKHQGYQPFWEKLIQLRSRYRRGRKRESIDALMHYVAERKSMLDYPRHLARGWDIGSGPTESMCKVMTHRVKGCGQRWNVANAEAIMALEGLLQSRLWSRWWESRLKQAA